MWNEVMRSIVFFWSRRLFIPVIQGKNGLIGVRWQTSASPGWWSDLDYNSVLEKQRPKRAVKGQSIGEGKSRPIPVALASLLNTKQTEADLPTEEPKGQGQNREVEEVKFRNEDGRSSPLREESRIDTVTIRGSGVPCGGCGAELHSDNSEFPGYMEKGRLNRMSKKELRREVCERCYLLAERKTALKVTVPPEEYPSVLAGIQNEFAMVLLLVDLMDFPCSAWPNLVQLIGRKRPVFLVGNKVDLLPQDSAKYLKHVMEVMESTLRETSLQDANVVHKCLISADTGYGVEELISTILRLWRNKGHIYIMGCTNVGKSSLFNLFLQSDLCEVQVGDLIQRATVSEWPGTTLNLLKFPVLRAHPWRLAARSQRLRTERPSTHALQYLRQFELKESKDRTHAVPVGHVGQSFVTEVKDRSIKWAKKTNDLFHVNPSATNAPYVPRPGSFEPDDFEEGPWCFDTPGVLGFHQMASELSLEELELCMPKTVVVPRMFILRPGKTLFVGGLVRIDYVEGVSFIRLTVFTSHLLPVTVLDTEKASEVYAQGLGTEVFGVPFGAPSRLKFFPPLKSTSFQVEGIGHRTCAADIVLSSLGWVSVSGGYESKVELEVHTPGGKGLFCRRPSLLPQAVRLKGTKLRDIPTYSEPKTFVPPLRPL